MGVVLIGQANFCAKHHDLRSRFPPSTPIGRRDYENEVSPDPIDPIQRRCPASPIPGHRSFHKDLEGQRPADLPFYHYFAKI